MSSPSSPLSALGMTGKILQPTDSNFWNYERLANCSPDQILNALEMVSRTFLHRFFEIYFAHEHMKKKPSKVGSEIAEISNYWLPKRLEFRTIKNLT